MSATLKIMPCPATCACPYCLVEGAGGETVRTAAQKVVEVFDRGDLESYFPEGSKLIDNLREHLK